jgi:hypothetical protein
MTINAEIKARFAFHQLGANDFGGPRFDAAIDFAQAFANGVGGGQADIAYIAERAVASASNDDIDLAGVLSDALGTTIAAAELVALFLLNRQKSGAANTTNLTIGGGSNPVAGFLGGTTPTIGPIRPGCVFLLSSPDAAGIGAVVAGTGDILRIANSAGAQNKYLIGILARSA